MAAAEKPSVSGLMTQSHEVSRFETLFLKSINTAYYNVKWGLDWDFWLNGKFEMSVESFLSYVTQEATKRGIVITDLNATVEDFTLTITAVIEGITYSTNRNFLIGVS